MSDLWESEDWDTLEVSTPKAWQQLLSSIELAGDATNTREGARARLDVQMLAVEIKSRIRLANAADRHARSLTRATWFLAAATAILAVSTIVLVWVTATGVT